MQLSSNFYDQALVPGFSERYKIRMKYKGFGYALLSTLRYMPLEGLESSFQAIGASRKPVLLIWGKEDRIVPFAVSEKAKAAMPQAELLTVEQAGHLSNAVNGDLVD